MGEIIMSAHERFHSAGAFYHTYPWLWGVTGSVNSQMKVRFVEYGEAILTELHEGPMKWFMYAEKSIPELVEYEISEIEQAPGATLGHCIGRSSPVSEGYEIKYLISLKEDLDSDIFQEVVVYSPRKGVTIDQPYIPSLEQGEWAET
jgi:hypothetical protein